MWNGLPLSPEGRDVRAALLAISADLPAMRMVTQFGCPRCKFQAEREPGTTSATGKMSYYTSSMLLKRTHDEVVSQAIEYQQTASKSDALL